MSHSKSRSDFSTDGVDWNDPYLSSLLEKTVGWRLDNRSNVSPQKVQIHIRSGWATAESTRKPALLVAREEGSMVIVTRFPIQIGEHVGVESLRGDGTNIVWGKVARGREGRRAEDREHGLFLNWLRLD